MAKDATSGIQVEHSRDLAIARVETTILDVPIRRLHKLSALTMAHQSYLLVIVTTHGGLVSYGEGATPGGPWWSGESVETMKAMIDGYLGPAIIGTAAGDIRKAVAAMDRVAARAPFAKAALDIALWDLAAKAANRPLSTLFGGKLRDGIALRWALATGDLDADLEEARQMMANDLASAFKIKGGTRGPAEDVAYSKALRDGLGPDVSLQIDLNAMWDRATALRHGPELMGLVDYIEQPLAEWDSAGLAELRASGIRVMADESLYSPQDAMVLAQLRAVDYFSIKLMKSGGISGAKAVAEIAQAVGIGCYAGTFMESSLGIAAHLQLATTLPGLTEGGELLGGLWLAEDIAEEPVTYHDGQVFAPVGVGHGVTPDADKIRHFQRN